MPSSLQNNVSTVASIKRGYRLQQAMVQVQGAMCRVPQRFKTYHEVSQAQSGPGSNLSSMPAKLLSYNISFSTIQSLSSLANSHD